MKLYLSKGLILLFSMVTLIFLWSEDLVKNEKIFHETKMIEPTIELKNSDINSENTIEIDPKEQTEVIKTENLIIDQIKNYIEFLSKLEKISFLISEANFIESEILLEEIISSSYAQMNSENFISIKGKISELSKIKEELLFPANNFFISWIGNFFKISKFDKISLEKNKEKLLYEVMILKKYYYEKEIIEKIFGKYE